jgi:hypothetical protein
MPNPFLGFLLSEVSLSRSRHGFHRACPSAFCFALHLVYSIFPKKNKAIRDERLIVVQAPKSSFHHAPDSDARLKD